MADDLRKYLKQESKQDNVAVKLQPRLTAEQLKQNKEGSGLAKFHKEQADRNRQLALANKGQSDLSNFANDLGTTMLTNVTEFRQPTLEEKEKGRSGWNGRAELIRNGVTHGLANELVGGAITKVPGLINSAKNALTSSAKLIPRQSLATANAKILSGPESSFLMGTEEKAPETIGEGLATGNKWLKEWYDHPEIKRRIKLNNRGVMKDNANGIDRELMDMNPEPKVKFPSFFEDKVAADKAGTEKMFTPSPLGEYGGLFYPNRPEVHLTLRNKAFVNPELAPAKVAPVTVHEGGHYVTNGGAAHSTQTDDMLEATMGGKKSINFLRDMNTGNKDALEVIDYLSMPTEIHANLNQMRMHYGLTPTDKVTSERASEMIYNIRAGKVPLLDREFGVMLRDPKALAKAFNRVFTPAAIGTTAALKLNE